MKLIKLLAAILVISVPLFALPQGSWKSVNVPTTQNLYSVFFTDSLYGWAVGDSGTIIHTTDGGNNWLLQNSQTTNSIVTVFFLTRTMGWASAFNYSAPPYGTTLLKTTNGGTTWTPSLYPEENKFITCIHYFDSLHGWMGGKPHALVETTDGGNSWTQAAIDTSTLAFFPVLKLAFLNEQVGFACGGIFDIAGVIWRTDNGGELWHALDASQAPADEVHALHIFDALNIMGAGGDPDYGYGVGMIRSSDGGVNWVYDEIGIQGLAFDLDFRNATEVWAPLGPLRKMIVSMNASATWTEVSTPDSTAIYDVMFADSLHGCAVGNDGAVLKYIPPVVPVVTPLPFPADNEITCKVNPNPTSGNLKFEIRNLTGGFASIQILTLMGSEVAMLVNEELAPGVHSFSFNTGDLPVGVYLYQLRVDGVVAVTERFVVCP